MTTSESKGRFFLQNESIRIANWNTLTLTTTPPRPPAEYDIVWQLADWRPQKWQHAAARVVNKTRRWYQRQLLISRIVKKPSWAHVAWSTQTARDDTNLSWVFYFCLPYKSQNSNLMNFKNFWNSRILTNIKIRTNFKNTVLLDCLCLSLLKQLHRPTSIQVRAPSFVSLRSTLTRHDVSVEMYFWKTIVCS